MSNIAPYTAKPFTDIFTSDTSIDRTKCQRTVPMKVLVLGLGRTGTASIRSALKKLGYVDTYHMMNASVENPPDCAFWKAAFEAKYEGKGPKFTRKEWDQILGHCQAVCDWPAACFGKELIEAYPEAKVILTNRDPDSWHRSTMKTVNWRVNDPELRLVSKVDWGSGYYYPMLRKMFDTFFRGDFEKYGKSVYREHYKEIRTCLSLPRNDLSSPSPEDDSSPSRLLEYEVSQGWGPLCEFLGQPIPDTPFPRSNDVGSFSDRCRRRNRMQACNAALRFVVGGVLAYLLWVVCVEIVLPRALLPVTVL